MAFDIVLKGGHVIDPKNGIDAALDVALSDGKVAAVAADLPTEDVGRCIDVSGLYVVPGLVDIHMHAYATPGHRDAWAGDGRPGSGAGSVPLAAAPPVWHRLPHRDARALAVGGRHRGHQHRLHNTTRLPRRQ